MAHQITVAKATKLAAGRVRQFELSDGRVYAMNEGRAHPFGWSFSYTCGGQVLPGAPLIFVTRTRRIYEIGSPFNVEQFVATVLIGEVD